MTQRDLPIPADIEALLLHALAEAGVPPPSGDLKARVLARVADAVRADTAIATVRAGEGGWQEIGRGVSARTLRDDGVTRTWLARMSPGASVPEHDHEGDEEIFVLEGSVTLDEIELNAGDYQVARRGSHHAFVASRRGCLALMRTPSSP